MHMIINLGAQLTAGGSQPQQMLHLAAPHPISPHPAARLHDFELKFFPD